MKRELIAQKNPKSPIAETFRTLRTNLQFMNSRKKLRTILVTSTMPGEGKTWVSSNLATTFAQTGKKVLIVDADMRKGLLSTVFSTNNKPGLSNFLSGTDENGLKDDMDLLKYIKNTDVDNLYLIPCGNYPPNPSELLGSEVTLALIAELEKTFDIIIFDGTPSLIVTDAIILSRIVDTTVLVAEYNKTKKENLAKIKSDIERVGGSIAGVVMNKMPVNAKEYQSTYYYSSRELVPQKNNKKKDKQSEYKKDSNQERINYILEDMQDRVSKEKKEEILNELNRYLYDK